MKTLPNPDDMWRIMHSSNSLSLPICVLSDRGMINGNDRRNSIQDLGLGGASDCLYETVTKLHQDTDDPGQGRRRFYTDFHT